MIIATNSATVGEISAAELTDAFVAMHIFDEELEEGFSFFDGVTRYFFADLSSDTKEQLRTEYAAFTKEWANR